MNAYSCNPSSAATSNKVSIGITSNAGIFIVLIIIGSTLFSILNTLIYYSYAIMELKYLIENKKLIYANS